MHVCFSLCITCGCSVPQTVTFCMVVLLLLHSFVFEGSPSYEVFMLFYMLVHECREHSLLCTVMFMWCMQAEIFSVSSALFSDIVHVTHTSHDNHHDFTMDSFQHFLCSINTKHLWPAGQYTYGVAESVFLN